MVMAMALFVIAALMVFFVFNSGRTVNEKINLVNAADAAAYSGAEITARQLNFMAYTNRAMIANEVAVGHMFSFQMETDTVNDLLGATLNNLNNPLVLFIANVISGIINILTGSNINLGALLSSSVNTFISFLDTAGQVSRGLTGIYAITVDANNAFYSSLQAEAFKDFAYPTESRPLVETAMLAVLNDYQVRNTAPIELNNTDVLTDFASNGNQHVQAAAKAATTMNSDFCRMVLFVHPGQIQSGDVGTTNDMDSFCNSVLSGGEETSGVGTPDGPTTDNGAMLSMLRNTVSNFGNADWINTRDRNYYLTIFKAQRHGNTTVDYSNNQLNWSASDSLRLGDPIFNLQVAKVSRTTDITSMSQEASSYLNDTIVQMFRSMNLCDDGSGDGSVVDCAALSSGQYRGVQRYAYLNPGYTTPTVTAFLSQANCSDNIGVDTNGNPVQGWHNNLPSFEKDKPVCGKTVYAVSQAVVFFQRPSCYSGGANCSFGFSNVDETGQGFVEAPNLYNPFWQARIVAN